MPIKILYFPASFAAKLLQVIKFCPMKVKQKFYVRILNGFLKGKE
jgi:hypothetical protein